MGRFTRPRTRVCRRLGHLVFDNTNVEKAYLKRESIAARRRKDSEYGLRLREKQKIMFYYGMREQQMRRFFKMATRQKGNSGVNFLLLCERRLDNVVYSAGFAPSRAAARQLVTHGNVRINGKRVDIPSFLVSAGDTLTFANKPGITKLVNQCIERKAGYTPPDWIATDPKTRTAKVVRLPLREDVRLPVNEQLVVEFYSR